MKRLQLMALAGLGALLFCALALADPGGPISPVVVATPKPIHVSWHFAICDLPPGPRPPVPAPVRGNAGDICAAHYHGVLEPPPATTVRLKFFRWEGEPVAGSAFAAVVGYWSGSTPELASQLKLNYACTASIIRPWNGRLLASLGPGVLVSNSSIFVRETLDDSRIPAMLFSWNIPQQVAGKSTVDKALVVRCGRLKLDVESSGSDTLRVVSARRVHPDFVRWFHIYRVAP